MFRKKIRNYISDIDIFLQDFDRTHAKSESQLAEIQKYQRVFALRDKPIADMIHKDEFFT